MTIGRRGVMRWGALGIGSAALDACGGGRQASKLPSAGGVSTAPTAAPEDVDRLLAELDRVLLELKSFEAESARPGVHRTAADEARREATCTRLLTTLCVMGTYRDVPRSVWHEPRVGERLAKTLPEIGTTIDAARTNLVAITDEHGARLDAKLRDDPDLSMRIMERIDEQARRIRVPLEQRVHLRAATAQLSGRLRYEGTKDVTASLVAKYDRAVASRMSLLGMQPDQDGPPVDVDGSPAPIPAPLPPPAATRRLGAAGESCRTTADCEQSLVCSETTCKILEGEIVEVAPRSVRLTETTKKTAIVGAWLLLPPVCAIGVLVLLTCLFMLIVASSLSASGD